MHGGSYGSQKWSPKFVFRTKSKSFSDDTNRKVDAPRNSSIILRHNAAAGSHDPRWLARLITGAHRLRGDQSVDEAAAKPLIIRVGG